MDSDSDLDMESDGYEYKDSFDTENESGDTEDTLDDETIDDDTEDALDDETLSDDTENAHDEETLPRNTKDMFDDLLHSDETKENHKSLLKKDHSTFTARSRSTRSDSLENVVSRFTYLYEPQYEEFYRWYYQIVNDTRQNTLRDIIEQRSPSTRDYRKLLPFTPFPIPKVHQRWYFYMKDVDQLITDFNSSTPISSTKSKKIPSIYSTKTKKRDRLNISI